MYYVYGQDTALELLGLEKTALSLSTLQSYLKQRAGQSIGGAGALHTSLLTSPATTSRQAVQGMTGLQKHQLGGVMERSQAMRQSQKLPGLVGLGDVAANTRARVGGAVQAEAAGAPTRTGVPLSKAYEGYMSPECKSYSPDHVEAVMGLPAGSYATRQGPTSLMRPTEPPPPISGVRSTRRAIDPLANTEVSMPNTVISMGQRRRMAR